MDWDNGDEPKGEEEEEDTTNMAMVAMDIPATTAEQFPALIQTTTNKSTTSQKNNKDSTSPPDPNIANPRLLVNRGCIYERRLPGNAYITAHVQRLQHGYYASPAVSDRDFDFVDFLAVHFVFHSPNTLDHRFKAATIRASVQGTNRESTPPRTPRFLMHAPHLIYGAVSPETLQWNFSLAGSLGIADMPVSASFNPSGGMNGRYKRYEMMRIQGSARTWKSPRGPKFDIETGEVVWSLEENTLQRSGLPREFSFPMLIQKPRAESKVLFNLDIEPVVQSWYGNYPTWWLSLPNYRPVHRKQIDFRRQIGQRFKPVTSKRGFNFASLESCFDDYVHMPGRKHTSSILPEGMPRDDTDSFDRNGGGYGNVEPINSFPGSQQQNQQNQYNQQQPSSAFNPTFNPNFTFNTTATTQPTNLNLNPNTNTATGTPNVNAVNVRVLLDSTTTRPKQSQPQSQQQRQRASSISQPSTSTTQQPQQQQQYIYGRRRSLRRNNRDVKAIKAAAGAGGENQTQPQKEDGDDYDDDYYFEGDVGDGLSRTYTLS